MSNHKQAKTKTYFYIITLETKYKIGFFSRWQTYKETEVGSINFSGSPDALYQTIFVNAVRNWSRIIFEGKRLGGQHCAVLFYKVEEIK